MKNIFKKTCKAYEIAEIRKQMENIEQELLKIKMTKDLLKAIRIRYSWTDTSYASVNTMMKDYLILLREL